MSNVSAFMWDTSVNTIDIINLLICKVLHPHPQKKKKKKKKYKMADKYGRE